MSSNIGSESEPQSPDTEPYIDTKKCYKQYGVTDTAKGRNESSSKEMIAEDNGITKEEVDMDDTSDSLPVSDEMTKIEDCDFEAVIGEPVYIKEESNSEWTIPGSDIDLEEGEQAIEFKTENEFLHSEQEQWVVQHNLRSDDSSDMIQRTTELEKQQLACLRPDTTANNNTAKIRPTTSAERELLWKLISEEEELHNTGNTAQILMAKKQAFTRVTRKFNAAGLGQERTYEQLHGVWGRMKKKKRLEAKKKNEERDRSMSKNISDGSVSEHVVVSPSPRQETQDDSYSHCDITEAVPRVECSSADASMSEEVDVMLDVESINNDIESRCCSPSSHLDVTPSSQSFNISTISSFLAYAATQLTVTKAGGPVPVNSDDCKCHRHMVASTNSQNTAYSLSTTSHLESYSSTSHRPFTSHNKENRRSVDEPWLANHDMLKRFAVEEEEAQKVIRAKEKRLLQLQLQKAELKMKLYKQKLALASLKTN